MAVTPTLHILCKCIACPSCVEQCYGACMSYQTGLHSLHTPLPSTHSHMLQCTIACKYIQSCIYRLQPTHINTQHAPESPEVLLSGKMNLRTLHSFGCVCTCVCVCVRACVCAHLTWPACAYMCVCVSLCV